MRLDILSAILTVFSMAEVGRRGGKDGRWRSQIALWFASSLYTLHTSSGR